VITPSAIGATRVAADHFRTQSPRFTNSAIVARKQRWSSGDVAAVGVAAVIAARVASIVAPTTRLRNLGGVNSLRSVLD
jgi:hypothetical protein